MNRPPAGRQDRSPVWLGAGAGNSPSDTLGDRSVLPRAVNRWEPSGTGRRLARVRSTLKLAGHEPHLALDTTRRRVPQDPAVAYRFGAAHTKFWASSVLPVPFHCASCG